MTNEQLFAMAADGILLVHLLVVAFIVLGLALVVAGGLAGWRWVRNPWFRGAHLLAIGIVVLQAWLGKICPLTTWEMLLRRRAGDAAYDGAFIAHWLGGMLYVEAPLWVFALVYTGFGSLVVGCWYWVRPRSFKCSRGKGY